ncbi:hypothetical protein MC7420_3724 [Coleofasciculus chthonoplastes PCC 7420]|uniref:Uncharacterized protein n=1 Tax=Coleofasciculus chthonoplastes PCC 7420 TaxID=118168 RepID=B4VX69_9CYAN|nr:hypothetical protein MC7420_3724 [Coleofasciculus chthonoplastes PCC 7420]
MIATRNSPSSPNPFSLRGEKGNRILLLLPWCADFFHGF